MSGRDSQPTALPNDLVPKYTEADFERTARTECADVLRIIREAFSPSKALEAAILVAFAKGATWAMDVENIRSSMEAPHG